MGDVRPTDKEEERQRERQGETGTQRERESERDVCIYIYIHIYIYVCVCVYSLPLNTMIQSVHQSKRAPFRILPLLGRKNLKR